MITALTGETAADERSKIRVCSPFTINSSLPYPYTDWRPDQDRSKKERTSTLNLAEENCDKREQEYNQIDNQKATPKWIWC